MKSSKLWSLFALLPLLLGVAYVQAQSEWLNVSNSDDNAYDIKSGSLEETMTKAGVEVATVIGRVNNLKTKRIDLEKWYVSVTDCNRELGKLVTLDLDGQYKHENAFVFEGGNVSSRIAQMICGSLSLRTKTRQGKGI